MVSILLFACQSISYSQNNLSIIKQNFLAFDTNLISSRDSLNELSALYRIAQSKYVVSIGEVTHGTDEIKKIQNIFSKGLIQNSNFKVIALGESPLLDSYPLYDYVVNKRGNPKALANLFHFDIYELLIWMKEYNEDRQQNEKVCILGCGIDSPEKILDFVSGHLNANLSSGHSEILTKITNLFANKTVSSKQEIDSLKSYNMKLMRILNANKNGVDSLNFKIELMIRSLEKLPILYMKRDSSMKLFLERDKVIAQNVEWLLTHKGKTAVMFTHNLHINKKALEKGVYGSEDKPMGEYLAIRYADKYWCLATEIQNGQFYNGSIYPQKITEDSLKIGNLIGSAISSNYGYLLFDENLRNFFNSKNFKMTKGTLTSTIIDGRGIIGNAFDGVIFIRTSNPYKFWNEKDFCTLYINLDEDLRSIVASKKIDISTHLQAQSQDNRGSILYSIYFNDAEKKILRHKTYLYSPSDTTVTFDIPEQTKYISVSLAIQNIQYLKLNKIKINDKSIPFSRFQFFDWNRKGYIYKPTKKFIVITK